MASSLRRAVDWAFRDRRTGAIVIGQWPNFPLWLFAVVSASRWVLVPDVVPDLWLRIASGVALAWWAADECLRGVNPWRRLLGSAVMAGLVVSAVRMLAVSGSGA